MVEGLGIRASSERESAGFGFWGFWLKDRVEGLKFRVQGLGFRV